MSFVHFSILKTENTKVEAGYKSSVSSTNCRVAIAATSTNSGHLGNLTFITPNMSLVQEVKMANHQSHRFIHGLKGFRHL